MRERINTAAVAMFTNNVPMNALRTDGQFFGKQKAESIGIEGCAGPNNTVYWKS
jgi:hypothetical protein